MMQPIGQMMLYNLDKMFSSIFLFNLMQKTEQKLNNVKIKTFPENKKNSFPKPQKPNIYAVLLWLSKTLFLTASAAAATEWSHITLCWWVSHSQSGRKSSLVRAKYTSLVHWVKWTNGQGIRIFFSLEAAGKGLLTRYFGTICY